MIVSKDGSFARIVFLWQWKYTVYYIVAATLVVGVHELYPTLRELLGWAWLPTELREFLELPTLPLAVVGAALGIFVSFRTNQAYDRWWEGRKLWGRMINTSRHFTTQVVSYLRQGNDGPTEIQRRLVLRHVTYVHALRCLLRGQDPFGDPDVKAHLEPDDSLKSESNLTHALLQRQLDELAELNREGALNDFRLQSMDQSLRELLDIQGGCERIKKTPMPPIYALLATRIVQFYAFLFPLGVVHDLHWWAIPTSLLVCTAFSLIAEAGRVLEDPFTMFFNGLPLSAISRMIEVNVRQRLGETDLPPMLQPTPGYAVLM
ncbi:MAG: bestrophin family protein [Sandaracinaceae bacterium]